jgi:hypothetical protein
MRTELRGWVGALALVFGLGLFLGACDDDGPSEPGRVCGGIAGVACPDGQVCELPAGECQVNDNQGMCVARPEGCLAVFLPVCGSDGQTYGNDCERLRAGVPKDHDGACT